jgi:hypothetical protein
MFRLSSSCAPNVASGLSLFITPSEFSNIYLSCVLCALYCQFLYRIHKTQDKYMLENTEGVMKNDNP